MTYYALIGMYIGVGIAMTTALFDAEEIFCMFVAATIIGGLIGDGSK
jgi:hypothetical protein